MSKRDRSLTIGLPSVLIALIYGFFFMKPAMDASTELKRQQGILEEQVPNQATVSKSIQDLTRLRREVGALKKADEAGGGTSLVDAPSAEATMAAEVFFEELLQAHRVILMSESLAELNEVRAYRKVVDRSPGTTLWNVELAGNYESVARLLIDLGRAELPLTLIAVEMSALLQTQSDLRRWNLWIYR